MDDSGLSKIFEQTLKSVGIPGFLVVPGFVLMAPDGWLDCIGLLKARNDHKMWFGVALLLGIAMLIKAVGSYVWKLAQEVTTRVKQRRELDRFIQLMDTLDDQETLLLVKAHVDYFGDAALPLDELAQSTSETERNRVQYHLISLGLLEFSPGLNGRHIHLTERANRLMKGYSERSIEGNVKELIRGKP